MENLVLQINDLRKGFPEPLFEIPELSVYENDRIGIIGDNGAGKSTLLKLIAGKLAPDSGQINRQVDFDYFGQLDPLLTDYRAEQLDAALLGRLKVPAVGTELSGGESAKLRLTQILSVYHQGLLLDEPTTHLDQESIQFLIEELRYYYGTLLFVSHDRHFLNELATKIWVVSAKGVREFVGNFQDYQETLALEQVTQERAHEKYLKEKRRLEQAAAQRSAQAQKMAQVSQKAKQKNIRPSRLSASKQKDTVQKALQKNAKALEKRAEQLTEVTSVKEAASLRFPLAKQLQLHNRFPVRGEVQLTVADRLLLTADFQVPLGQKVALTGANGSGKSTLLRHIYNEGAGMVISPKVVMAMYRQMSYRYTDETPLLRYLLKQTTFSESLVRSALHRLDFGERHLLTPLHELSGGEATRLALLELFLKPTNVLLLDEPTNFIDVRTIDALAALLAGYEGTVLFTSHDQTFVQENADLIWRIEAGELRQ